MIESTTTTPSDFYSGSRILLEGIIDEFLSCIGMIRRYQKSQTGWDPISSSTSRVKSPESMREKLIRDGLEPTLQNALAHEHDAAGVRLICPMVDDVYRTAELIRAIPDVTILREKDFIAHPKPNGYRSLHLIVEAIEPYDFKDAGPFSGKYIRDSRSALSGSPDPHDRDGLLGEHRT